MNCRAFIQPVVTTAASLLLVGCAALEGPDSVPGSPINVSPENGADLVINAPTRFVWTPVEGASHYDFHIFNRSNGDIAKYYEEELRAEDVCSADQCVWQTPVALPYLDDHAWRVRSGNIVGKSNWTRSLFNMVGSGIGADQRDVSRN